MITIGTLLFTRDGRKMGNGIVIDVFTSRLVGSKFNYYVVKTDFGNVIPMRKEAIEKQFFIDDYTMIVTPKAQLSEQLTLLDKVVDTLYGN